MAGPGKGETRASAPRPPPLEGSQWLGAYSMDTRSCFPEPRQKRGCSFASPTASIRGGT